MREHIEFAWGDSSLGHFLGHFIAAVSKNGIIAFEFGERDGVILMRCTRVARTRRLSRAKTLWQRLSPNWLMSWSDLAWTRDWRWICEAVSISVRSGRCFAKYLLARQRAMALWHSGWERAMPAMSRQRLPQIRSRSSSHATGSSRRTARFPVIAGGAPQTCSARTRAPADAATERLMPGA